MGDNAAVFAEEAAEAIKPDDDELRSEAQDEEADAKTKKGWENMVKYVEKSHGDISKDIVTRMIEKSGFKARGIAATGAIKEGDTLFEIPKGMWIHIDNFPDVKSTDINCGYTSTRVVTALALEIQKGEKSNWHTYIENMPSRADLKRFYPRWAADELMETFNGLSIVEDMTKKRGWEQDHRECWEKWSKKHKKSGNKPDLGDLTWNEMEFAYALWRSRNYGFGDGENALIPVSDFMNTSPSSEFNARWRASNKGGDENGTLDVFKVLATANMSSDDEFLESYCRECSNFKMLETWGIYMEDNPVAPDKANKTVCEKVMPKAKSNLEEKKENEKHTAPRCKTETLDKEQGPLVCSFSRFAWEVCDGVEDGKEQKHDGEKEQRTDSPETKESTKEGRRS